MEKIIAAGVERREERVKTKVGLGVIIGAGLGDLGRG